MRKKHPCPDCRQCQWCSDSRCALCLGEAKPCHRKLSQAEQIALYESINRGYQQQKTADRTKQRVLFVCTDNACRSPMAAALANHDFGDLLEAFSAGTAPTSLSPHAVAVMAELGIDIGPQNTAPLSHYQREPFDFVFTLCDQADNRCPLYFGGVKRRHLDVADPLRITGNEPGTITACRAARDTIRQQLAEIFCKHPPQQQPDCNQQPPLNDLPS